MWLLCPLILPNMNDFDLGALLPSLFWEPCVFGIVQTLLTSLFWEPCCRVYFENLVVGFILRTLCRPCWRVYFATLCHWLFWEPCAALVVGFILADYFLPPLKSPLSTAVRRPCNPPRTRQIRILRYVLWNSPYNTYREMSGITVNGWDNDKWVWMVLRMVPPKVFEMVW